MPKTLNIAHRGDSKSHPENTLAAFRAAVELSVDMCELDVQLTRDGALVVIHDDTVNRTTDGKGAVAELTLDEIRRLDAGRGERVPTLEDVFAATRGRCGLNIELKVAGAERKVAQLMRAAGALADSMVSSFDWDALAAMQRVDSEVRIGVLAEKKPERMLDTAARLHAYAINPHYKLATRELCADAHSRQLKVLVWTVDDPSDMSRLIENGVDGIMTNYPARLSDVLRLKV